MTSDPVRHWRPQCLCHMMEADETTLLGPVNGTFTFKNRPEAAVDKSTVENFSLKYHLNTKTLAANPEVWANTASDANASSQSRQVTLDQVFRLSQSTCDRLTNSLTEWTADSLVGRGHGANCVQHPAASLWHIWQHSIELKFFKHFSKNWCMQII